MTTNEGGPPRAWKVRTYSHQADSTPIPNNNPPFVPSKLSTTFVTKVLPSMPSNGKSGEDLTGKSEKSTENKSAEAIQAKEELFQAIISNNLETIPNLIKQVLTFTNGINYREGKEKYTLLHRCVNQNVSTEAMKTLIENGVRVDAKDFQGASALHIAAEKGNPETIKFLLENHANPMLKDKENKIALHKGAISGKVQSLEILLESPVLINHQDIYGQTALHLAVRFERRDCVKYLVNKGADMMILSSEGKRAIDFIPQTTSTKKVKHPFTPTGKKIYKFLKRKGGNKPVSTTTHQQGFYGLGEGIRCYSLDHRALHNDQHSSNSSQHQSNPLSNPGPLNQPISGSHVVMHSARKDSSPATIPYNSTPSILISNSKDSDDESTSLSDTNDDDISGSESESTEVSNQESSTPNTPTQRVDRHGFIINEKKSSGTSKKKSKKIQKLTVAKEQKLTLKWLTMIRTWEVSFVKHRAKVLFSFSFSFSPPLPFSFSFSPPLFFFSFSFSPPLFFSLLFLSSSSLLFSSLSLLSSFLRSLSPFLFLPSFSFSFSFSSSFPSTVLSASSLILFLCVSLPFSVRFAYPSLFTSCKSLYFYLFLFTT